MTPKPAAAQVTKYFFNQFLPQYRLDFKYSKVYTPPDSADDQRNFSIFFIDKMKFLAKNGAVLDSLSFGAIEGTNQYQGRGWYANESAYQTTCQWAGSLDALSSLYYRPPGNTDSLQLSLVSELPDNKLEILINGETKLGEKIIPNSKWHYENFTIPFHYPNAAPHIENLVNFSFERGKNYILDLDTCVTDLNDPVTELRWEIKSDTTRLKWHQQQHIVTFYSDKTNEPYDTAVRFKVIDPDSIFDIHEIIVSVTTAVAPQFSRTRTFALYQNYPNPFNPGTKIQYQLAKPSLVKITVFNALGENVCLLVDAKQEADLHAVEWFGQDDRGMPVASGVYFCRIKAGNFVSVRKMLILR